MGKAIDVKHIVEKRRKELKATIDFLNTQHIQPQMKVILVGENPASMSYVKWKEKAAHDIGMEIEILRFPVTVTENELVQIIQKINEEDETNGLIVQLPLPKHIDESKIIHAIDPIKDIDGFHPIHLGNLLLNKPTLVSCTPKGIMTILNDLDIPLAGQKVVVIGRSNIVGKPVSLLALNENATVTICHSHTKDLEAIARTADILIVAIGQPEFVTKDFVKEGAVVIDVGVNRKEGTTKLVGDVDFDDVIDTASLVTPVPGGVGPMTITMLMQNAIEATCHQNKRDFDEILQRAKIIEK